MGAQRTSRTPTTCDDVRAGHYCELPAGHPGAHRVGGGLWWEDLPPPTPVRPRGRLPKLRSDTQRAFAALADQAVLDAGAIPCRSVAEFAAGLTLMRNIFTTRLREVRHGKHR
jgi:hypothetical protein